MPRMLLHWDALGIFHFAAEPGVDVICIDERARHDRIYITKGFGQAGSIIDQVIAGADPIDATTAAASK